MASKEEYDRYAGELTRRFDEYAQWAIANWPNGDFPLLDSDFVESRRELSAIIGPKLGEPDPGEPSGATGRDDSQGNGDRNEEGAASRRPGDPAAAPFLPVSPSPWP
ncbi:hypothetical protein [Noviherbaspirillum sp.]|uniref:hypothetical protein n=1 Tax=Noviherbaspirillum sp. TaxID=1926288 RepID=UPI002FE39076